MMQALVQKGISRERIIYINFEDDRILPINSKELGAFIEAYYEFFPENKERTVFFFFDEIQNIGGWELFIRRIFDKERVKIFLTGSSSKLLSREIATSLRGRTLSFALYPLQFKDFLKFKGQELKKNFEYTSQRYKVKKLVEEYMEFGAFPEIVLSQNTTIKKRILKEYFDLLVYRDLAERFSMDNTALLKDILEYLFTNITSLFSVHSYYKNAKQSIPVSRATVTEYLGRIQETDYFFLLPRFSYSLKEQKVNPKKIICLDNGLRNQIAFRFSKDSGKLAENIVGSQLVQRGHRVYYWQGKQEGDFVIQINGALEAIQVSYGESIHEREAGALREFASAFPLVKKLTVITKDTEKKEKDIYYIPLWKWLL